MNFPQPGEYRKNLDEKKVTDDSLAIRRKPLLDSCQIVTSSKVSSTSMNQRGSSQREDVSSSSFNHLKTSQSTAGLQNQPQGDRSSQSEQKNSFVSSIPSNLQDKHMNPTRVNQAEMIAKSQVVASINDKENTLESNSRSTYFDSRFTPKVSDLSKQRITSDLRTPLPQIPGFRPKAQDYQMRPLLSDGERFMLLERPKNDYEGIKSPKFNDPSRALDITQEIYTSELQSSKKIPLNVQNPLPVKEDYSKPTPTIFPPSIQKTPTKSRPTLEHNASNSTRMNLLTPSRFLGQGLLDQDFSVGKIIRNISQQRNEEPHAERMFKMFDTNRSGYLESFELRKLGEVLFREYFPDSDAVENINFLTKVLDMDSDGKINQDDFSTYLRQFVMDDSLELTYTPLKIQHPSAAENRWSYSRFGMADPKKVGKKISSSSSPQKIEPGFLQQSPLVKQTIDQLRNAQNQDYSIVSARSNRGINDETDSKISEKKLVQSIPKHEENRSDLGHADSYIQKLVDENRNHRLRSRYYDSHTEVDVSGIRKNLEEKYTKLDREIDGMQLQLDLSDINKSPIDYKLNIPKSEEAKSQLTLESKIVSKAFVPNQNRWTFSRLDDLSQMDQFPNQESEREPKPPAEQIFKQAQKSEQKLNKTSSSTNIFTSKSATPGIDQEVKNRSQTVPPSPKNSTFDPFFVPPKFAEEPQEDQNTLNIESPKPTEANNRVVLISFEKPKYPLENKNSDHQISQNQKPVADFALQKYEINPSDPNLNRGKSQELIQESAALLTARSNLKTNKEHGPPSPPTTEHKKQLGAYIDFLQEKSRLSRELSLKHLEDGQDQILSIHQTDEEIPMMTKEQKPQNLPSGKSLLIQASPFYLPETPNNVPDTQNTLELSKTSFRAANQENNSSQSDLIDQEEIDQRLSIQIDFAEIQDFTQESQKDNNLAISQ